MKQRLTIGLVMASLLGLLVGVTGGASLMAAPDSNSQVAELYQLQAAFHRAGAVHDPVNGDSQAVINERIRDMLRLWAPDGTYGVASGPNAGSYVGTGDPDDPATCPAPSGSPGGVRGTLCSLFKYLAGSFQAANRWVSLAPAFLTRFAVHGNTADIYFECHFFEVGGTSPSWAATAHIAFDGTATKVHGVWLLSEAKPMPPAGVPRP